MDEVKLLKQLDDAADVNLQPYQHHCLSRFLKQAEFKGRDVLEIGGNGPQAVALTLNNLTGRRVVVLNPDPEYAHTPDEKRVMVLKQDACHTNLDDGSFDVILGIAVLEHIVDIRQFARECFRLLRPHGALVLQGGPLWHSGLGHHLFIVNQEMDYRFCGNNPVPDFAHLTHDADELADELLSRGLPQAHVSAITEAVYASRGLNRLPTEEIGAAFVSMPAGAVSFEFDLTAPPPLVQERLIQRGFDPGLNYAASNMYIYARKWGEDGLVAQFGNAATRAYKYCRTVFG
jgi:SAM-dependent methyltransferase